MMSNNYEINITSTAIQSTINGDSFTESLKQQLINTIVMAGANYTANQIGNAYHTNNLNFGIDGTTGTVVNKLTQLTLHAGLGAITNKLTWNDALSGAVSGVVGEVVAEITARSVYNKTTNFNNNEKSILKEVGGLAGAISSLIAGKARDLDISDIRNNVYSGYRVGKNAAENNLGHDQLLGNSRQTSGYANNRRHHVDGVVRNRNGVDVVPADGNNNIRVHASADGVSLGSYYQYNERNGTGWGNYIVIEHVDENGNRYITRYAHLEEQPDIPAGTAIREGQPIGTMGASGGVSGHHLYIMMYCKIQNKYSF